MNKYLIIGIVAILIIGGGWWYLNQSSAPGTSDTTEQTTQQNTNTGTQPTVTSQSTQSAQINTSSGMQTYTNAQYGVSLQYPNGMQTNTSPSYSPTYSSTAPDNYAWWYPFSNGGTNLFSVTSQGDVVLLAVSSNSSDVAECSKTTIGKTVSIGGISFQQLGGTDGSNGGASFVTYWTVHNNLCYAITRTINLDWKNQKATDQNSQMLDTIARSLKFN